MNDEDIDVRLRKIEALLCQVVGASSVTRGNGIELERRLTSIEKMLDALAEKLGTWIHREVYTVAQDNRVQAQLDDMDNDLAKTSKSVAVLESRLEAVVDMQVDLSRRMRIQDALCAIGASLAGVFINRP